jgi:lysophospholipase L1-like esterase
MKEKIKKIIQNKYLRFFLPIALYLLFEYGEKIIDIIIGDGDGTISSELFVKSHYLLNVIFISWAVFNVFSILFRMGRKATFFNFAIIFIILFSFEFYLKKQDLFLKGPFDSNYYQGNLLKYENSYIPPKGYKNENVITWGHKVNLNKYYFRDTEIIYPKPKGVFRVMVLGDSFTWGVGLSESEMYTNRLDSLLNNYFKEQKFEVVNCGLCGRSTTQERDILRNLKDTVQPDLIVVGFCVNDPQPKGQDYSIEKEKFQEKWGSFFTKLQNELSHLHLAYTAEAIVNAIYTYNTNSGRLPSLEVSLGRTYEPSSKDWKGFTQALKDIKNISDSLNCPKPIMAVFNQSASLYFHDSLNIINKRRLIINLNWMRQVYETASKIGFETINYYPIIDKEILNKKITRNNINVNVLDGHPSAELNAIYAKEIFERAKPLIQSKLNSPNL